MLTNLSRALSPNDPRSCSKRGCRELWQRHNTAKRLQVEYVKGWGSFVNANEVKVDLIDGGGETTMKAKNIMIATGSEPSSVPGLTIDEDKCAPTLSLSHICCACAQHAHCASAGADPTQTLRSGS